MTRLAESSASIRVEVEVATVGRDLRIVAPNHGGIEPIRCALLNFDRRALVPRAPAEYDRWRSY